MTWQPFKISKEACIVAGFFNDRDCIDDITKCGIPSEIMENILKELVDTKLFILDGNKLICNARCLVRFLYKDCNYICDNNDGDLDIWIKFNYNK